MKISHITNLSNNKSSGIARIVPLHIINQKQYVEVKWFNINEKYQYYKDDVINFKNILKDKNTKILNSILLSDLVVFHGVYFVDFYKISKILNKNKIPYIIVPHGSLTTLAVRQKKIKKKIAFKLFFNKFVDQSVAIQYLSKGEQEASLVSKNSKNIIVPNGVYSPNKLKETFHNDTIKAVFIGRKSIYYKGLDLLLNACKDIKEILKENNFTIEIYGPEEKGSNLKLSRMIKQFGLKENIKLFDEIYSNEKERVLLDSDIFILTSRTEGHPVGLIEALSYGIPCLVTTGTNMKETVNEFDAGWGTKTNVDDISSAILQIINDRNKLYIKSANALKLSEKYDWNNISAESILKYKELVKLDN